MRRLALSRPKFSGRLCAGESAEGLHATVRWREFLTKLADDDRVSEVNVPDFRAIGFGCGVHPVGWMCHIVALIALVQGRGSTTRSRSGRNTPMLRGIEGLMPRAVDDCRRPSSVAMQQDVGEEKEDKLASISNKNLNVGDRRSGMQVPAALAPPDAVATMRYTVKSEVR